MKMLRIPKSVSRSFRSVRAHAVALGLAVGLLAVSIAAVQSASAGEPARAEVVASAAQDPEQEAVVLPSRVSAAIVRTVNAVDRTEARIDDGGYAGAFLSLKAIGTDIGRAHRAGLRQLNAVPSDEEGPEEATAGPDAVVAVLTAEQAAITRLAGLFDGVTNAPVVNGLNSALTSAQTTRDKLVNAVVALDPEGTGADYADLMADTVDGYADEVANLTEALQIDHLTPAARASLNRALTRAKATQAKIVAVYGGGE
jgi:hypothetical protein